jgi:hypothetical protein
MFGWFLEGKESTCNIFIIIITTTIIDTNIIIIIIIIIIIVVVITTIIDTNLSCLSNPTEADVR